MSNINVPAGRLHALAFNVVQAARRAAGHADVAWTDDDARKAEMIYKILSTLESMSDGPSLDVDELIPAQQPGTHPSVVSMEKLLEDIAPSDLRTLTGAESLDQL